MRKVNIVVIHCSDSDRPSHDNIATVRSWHTEKGFTGPDGVKGTHDDIGYHYFIDSTGVVFPGRSESAIGAHVSGHNARSIGICLSGRERFTDPQYAALRILLADILYRYKLSWKNVVGHRDLDKLGKTCPNFEVKDKIAEWLKS